jgi:fructose-1,6-bisphosphatase/inositol monophosphatase family enzyme
MQKAHHSSFHSIIRPALLQAGRTIMQHFPPRRVDHKPDGSPLTAADLASEKILLAALKRHFPGDRIVSEEDGSSGTGPRTWFVDPLDGTAAFSEELAHFGPTLGLVSKGGQPIYGSMYIPRLEEEWLAEAGSGAYLCGLRLNEVANPSPTGNSVLYVPSKLHKYARIKWPGKQRSLGSIATHLCHVAAGRAAAAVVPYNWQPWDIVTGLVMLKETNATIRTLDGSPLELLSERRPAFAAGTSSAIDLLFSGNNVLHFQ